MQPISTTRRLKFVSAIPALLAALFAAGPTAWGVSELVQKHVPEDVSRTQAAILENNEAFVTFMTERALRTVAKKDIEIVKLDEAGDREFIRDNREQNGDYWYWAHQKAQTALILALGNAPLEAVRAIELIPHSEALIAEYRWIVEPEFREYLQKANEDLIYYFDPYVAIEVFLTNHQVSKLDRTYPPAPAVSGRGGRALGVSIPVLEISIQKLVATPRPGEEAEVGLEAILNLPGGGVTEPLLPSSKEYQERKVPIAEKMVTAADFQLKTIPVGARETKDLLEPFMGKDMKFLMIEGSMRESRNRGTEFSEDLKIVINPESSLTDFLRLHRGAFAKATVQKAQ